MEGSDAPISFQSRACQVCQDGGPLGLEGSGPTSTLNGKSSAVPCPLPRSAPSAHACNLLHRWGSCVVVGKQSQGLLGRHEQSALQGFVDVMIDRHDSMVGNPFVAAPVRRLCMAYDELLQLLLRDDFDFDRHRLDYHRLLDEHRSGSTSTESVERRLLLGIAARYDVRLAEANRNYARRHRLEGVRAWLAHHAHLLRSGVALRLLCHCVEGTCSPWSCHGQGLAGALTWLADYDRREPTTVRRIALPAPFMLAHTLGSQPWRVARLRVYYHNLPPCTRLHWGHNLGGLLD